MTNDADFVQSLARGLSVIRSFDAQNPVMNLSEIAKRTDISPAAARRFLKTLMILGYVSQRGRDFSLTPKVLELGFSYLSALSLPEIMQPHLEKLSQKLDESVSGAVLTDADIVYIARVSPRRIMTVGITLGTRFPAAATSMGRVLLAELPEVTRDQIFANVSLQAFTDRTITNQEQLLQELNRVKSQGWALVEGELEPGLCSVAAPIRGRDGDVQAAINISTSLSRHSAAAVHRDFLPQLLQTAAVIEQDLKLL